MVGLHKLQKKNLEVGFDGTEIKVMIKVEDNITGKMCISVNIKKISKALLLS